MIGNTKSKATIVGVIESVGNINGSVSSEAVIGDVQAGRIVIRHSDYPDYSGEYEVTPTPSSQTLETTNKTMRRDVEIRAIPYYDVSNPYGRTIYIGGDLNA